RPSRVRSSERPGGKRTTRCSRRSHPFPEWNVVRTSALPSRRGSTSSGWTTLCDAAATGTILGGCVQNAQVDGLDGVANPHSARFQHLAVHAEVELAPRAQTAVPVDDAQGVEVGNPGVGVLRRDRAAADCAAEAHERFADAHVPPEPLVLAVGLDTVDLEKHAEAASVHGLVMSRMAC